MAITLDQLISRVRRELRGYTLDQASMTVLAADMLAADSTFMVELDDITEISRGLVEIDDELILVKSYDSQTGVVSVMGGTAGRGAEDTTAATHVNGALVTSSPTFPRSVIKSAITDSIRALYPSLVVFDIVDFPYVAAQTEYPLPADVKDIWTIVGRWVGPEKVSGAMSNWRFNSEAYTADFPTGKSVQLWSGITPGQNVRVLYTREPSVLTANSDEFTTTGYPERVADLVVWDTAKRLLPSLMSARLQQTSVESTERAQLVGTSDVNRAVQVYAALYAERLQQERDRMYQEVPTYQTFQGS
ncbi:hypothetical protein ACFUJU_07885 [Streptomyces sp. NPDC057235]|uniref:phage adaptor protein n=1 Tax=Streptomyces sp. NPDC057235 TaxID=3346058 RepID=UPI00362BAFBE